MSRSASKVSVRSNAKSFRAPVKVCVGINSRRCTFALLVFILVVPIATSHLEVSALALDATNLTLPASVSAIHTGVVIYSPE